MCWTFEDRAALEACREEAGADWDNEEVYFVMDEWHSRIPARMQFEKLSHCAGVIPIVREPFTFSMM